MQKRKSNSVSLQNQSILYHEALKTKHSGTQSIDERKQQYKKMAYNFNKKTDARRTLKNKTMMASNFPLVNRHTFNIHTKEDQMISRILTMKQKKKKNLPKKTVTEPTELVYIMKRRNSLVPVVSMQQVIMKPTDKYFHQLDNIRLAQRLLLAKPTRQLSKDSLKKFYKEQEHFKFNISKLSYRSNSSKKDENSRKFKNKKWLN